MNEVVAVGAKLMHVYPLRCDACRNCELACAFSHLVDGRPTQSRIVAVPDEEKRKGYNTVAICLQCDSAACVSACPGGALQRNEKTGAIEVVAALCVRCRSCVPACPFGNMHWDWHSSSPLKCDLCSGDPICVKFCPTGAIVYR